MKTIEIKKFTNPEIKNLLKDVQMNKNNFNQNFKIVTNQHYSEKQHIWFHDILLIDPARLSDNQLYKYHDGRLCFIEGKIQVQNINYMKKLFAHADEYITDPQYK